MGGILIEASRVVACFPADCYNVQVFVAFKKSLLAKMYILPPISRSQSKDRQSIYDQFGSHDYRVAEAVFALLIHIWFPSVFIVQMDEIEIQQHYDEFFEEIYVEMEKVKLQNSLASINY